MLNLFANLVMSASVLKALPDRLDIKRHSPSILYHIHDCVVIHVQLSSDRGCLSCFVSESLSSSMRCPYDFMGPAKASCGDLCAPYDYPKSIRSFLGQDDNLKPCVVLTITVQCPYKVKQNSRGHNVRKSV